MLYCSAVLVCSKHVLSGPLYGFFCKRLLYSEKLQVSSALYAVTCNSESTCLQMTTKTDSSLVKEDHQPKNQSLVP